ncbi:PLP-dependent aminotransferase family protein [Rhodoferax sp.]|uniref:MocR-like pyridoxine biosynthesis transcription factor PdxR n=1 Tax=Rhodoferax sp. TaxID=50421 RepID=UPI0028510E60|nr:PLP-dependent aminotransferase family protein [Rhodoferax sp.]MDR3368238.1 PLP-dependent aminotransferase family protein [Rhodoferax sp.]
MSNFIPFPSTNFADVPAVFLHLERQLSAYTGSQTARVYAALRDAILVGELVSGTQLPPTRTLADWLRVARHAVVGAYESLQGDGLVVARVGAGSFVAPGLRQAKPPALSKLPALSSASADPITAFALGVPMLDSAFQQRLAAAVRRHMLSDDLAKLGYGDPRGSARLRVMIARDLKQSRGLQCSPEQIVIATGTQQVLRLCAQALMHAGDVVWMEEPGYPPAQRTLVAAGLRPLPTAVDHDGIAALACPAGLGAAKAIYVTPSHQFPTGSVMSLPRRLALLEWAHRNDAWILEDDYDSEFRYHGAPLTALAGLDRSERVIYIGTFSKSAYPALRLAYAVVPHVVLEAVVAARSTFDRFVPPMLELAMADLMADGSLARHLRRARGHCKRARDLLVRVLVKSSRGLLSVAAPDQGSHLLAWLPPGAGTDVAQRIRAASGLALVLLSEMRQVLSKGDREAFVVGFAGFSLKDVEQAADILGMAVVDHLSQSIPRTP